VENSLSETFSRGAVPWNGGVSEAPNLESAPLPVAGVSTFCVLFERGIPKRLWLCSTSIHQSEIKHIKHFSGLLPNKNKITDNAQLTPHASVSSYPGKTEKDGVWKRKVLLERRSQGICVDHQTKYF
jgi:hypothetical protein